MSDAPKVQEVQLAPGWFRRDGERALARIRFWWGEKHAQWTCQHEFEPGYHSWHCVKCGRVVHD